MTKTVFPHRIANWAWARRTDRHSTRHGTVRLIPNFPPWEKFNSLDVPNWGHLRGLPLVPFCAFRFGTVLWDVLDRSCARVRANSPLRFIYRRHAFRSTPYKFLVSMWVQLLFKLTEALASPPGWSSTCRSTGSQEPAPLVDPCPALMWTNHRARADRQGPALPCHALDE